jgi:hypothetical protein
MPLNVLHPSGVVMVLSRVGVVAPAWPSIARAQRWDGTDPTDNSTARPPPGC